MEINILNNKQRLQSFDSVVDRREKRKFKHKILKKALFEMKNKTHFNGLPWIKLSNNIKISADFNIAIIPIAISPEHDPHSTFLTLSPHSRIILGSLSSGDDIKVSSSILIKVSSSDVIITI